MPATSVEIDIHATQEDIFDVIHDYSLRLDWDPFLRDAELLGEAAEAGIGVCSRCAARWSVGGLSMETEYISFCRPRVAAVRMTRGPLCFRDFAASIRLISISECTNRVVYRFSFCSAPVWTARLVDPVLRFLLRRETQQRLVALKKYVEN